MSKIFVCYNAYAKEVTSEYDFFNFNTINGGGNVTATLTISPTLNNMGPDRPLKIAIQMDAQTPQTIAFIPPSAPGTLPAAWSGNDGFVADNAVFVPTTWSIVPGPHTLKVGILCSSLCFVLSSNIFI